ncbi:MAG: YHS domain-containing (seleno)protein [Pseudomonadota bacterium]|uniref:YHS domain-containing (seleno)protein n=1 Tax=Roseovarius TaxID=74030 RepID=UPI0022A8C824|nr:YHS domain-containing (seleno)protein [Roseovarius sp. EGI FJ00037]MCZ0813012.1 hypothetical protein [Roseovarius sp. EGI FJ00037]
MITRRNTLFAAAAAVGLALAGAAQAGSGKGHALNADENGVMLQGYDPVAYIKQESAVKGSGEITAEHQGVTYHFASAENRDTFAANPDAYVPAYGGYCAMGTAMGLKLDVKPELFRVVDERLYLNTAEGAQKKWLSDVSAHIRMADEKWAGIRDIPADQLEAN